MSSSIDRWRAVSTSTRVVSSPLATSRLSSASFAFETIPSFAISSSFTRETSFTDAPQAAKPVPATQAATMNLRT